MGSTNSKSSFGRDLYQISRGSLLLNLDTQGHWYKSEVSAVQYSHVLTLRVTLALETASTSAGGARRVSGLAISAEGYKFKSGGCLCSARSRAMEMALLRAKGTLAATMAWRPVFNRSEGCEAIRLGTQA